MSTVCALLLPAFHSFSQIRDHAGGIVAVTGPNTTVQLSSAVFFNCCLVVTGGASVTLEHSQFNMNRRRGTGISVYAAGPGSSVTLYNCSIAGGLQGALVKGGACLSAEQLNCVGTKWLGLEAQGAGSSLIVTSSTIQGVRTVASFEPTVHSYGILSGCGSACSISGTTINAFHVGCFVMDSHIMMKQNVLEGFQYECCRVLGFITAEFVGCKFNRSQERTGLHILESTSLKAQNPATVVACEFVGNKGSGITASGAVCLDVEGCRSEHNLAGFFLHTGASMMLRNCVSVQAQGAGALLPHVLMPGPQLSVERFSGRHVVVRLSTHCLEQYQCYGT
jgi:hypothetical protein